MIESSSSSGDSDTNNKFDATNLMENRNPMVRLVFFGRLKKMINNYKTTILNETDRKLIRGLFIKKLRDFDDEYREKMKKMSLLDRLINTAKSADFDSDIEMDSNSNRNDY